MNWLPGCRAVPRMLLAFAVALATLVGARTYALAQTTQPVRADAAGDLGDAALARWSDDTFGKAYSDGAFSGMALVVVRDGRGALRTQYGLARYNPDQPLEPGQTRLLIGSISKTFTGIAILQLVEAGRIRSIEEPANAYLERLQLPGARGAKISIKDLLTHSAGHELRNSGVGAHEVIASPVNGALASRLAPGLVRDPGVLVSYSNYATALLGLIVEDVTGEPIEAYFRREIWRPLGMDSARFQRGLTLEPGTATAYSKQPSGAYEPDHFIAFNPLYWPVGAVSLTLDDAVRYARFHLERARGVEGPVLSAAQHRRLTSVMRANHPDTGGFGFQIMSYEWNGRRLIGHGGTWVGYESMLLVSPDDDMALFFSIVGPRGMGNIEATRLLVPRLFGDDQPPRPAAAGTGVALADYAGVYRPAMRTDTRAEGVLAYLGGGDAAVVEATPDGLMIAGDGPFKPVGDDLFFHAQAKQTGANPFAMPRMAFYRDADGKVAGLTSHLGFTPLERVGPLGDPRWAASGLRWIGFALLLALPALFWPRRSVAELGVKAAALAPAACVFAIAPVLTMAMGPGGLGAYLIEGRTLRFAAASALANLTVLCAVVLTIAATIWIRDGGRRPVWARAHLTLTAALTCAASAILIAVHLVGFGRA